MEPIAIRKGGYVLRRRVWAILALSMLVLAACGDDEGDGGEGGGGGEEDLVVGISWNNYPQPRWAKADGPAIIKAVEAAGGTVSTPTPTTRRSSSSRTSTA